MECQILKNKQCQITNNYSSNHQALDLVGINPKIDYVVAHSDGKIVS